MNILPIRSGISVAVSGATNAIPIVMTTVAHELVTGDLVTITGVQGNTTANLSDKAVTVVSATTFSLAGIKGNGDYRDGGAVRTSDVSARARDYAAATAAAGTIRNLIQANPRDVFNFYVDAASDPGGANKEVDIIVYGRASPNSGWFVVQQISETTAGWAQVASGRWLNSALYLPVHPELRMDIVASASSTNTCKGWIAI